MSQHPILKIAAGSHRGRVRELNEDAVLTLVQPPEKGPAAFLAVADGMGGHQAGEVASRLALDTLRQIFSAYLNRTNGQETAPAPTSPNETVPGATSFLEQKVRLAITEANHIIFNYAQQNPEEAGNLGCTITCALIQGDLAVIANVGDSRTYLLRDGQLHQITEDHSYVGQLARSGQIEVEEIFDHPQRNVVTRALGSQDYVEVDIWAYSLHVGDRLLLCSDGLWEMVREPDVIAQLLGGTEDLDSVILNLIDRANAEGGTDNIAVVVAELASTANSSSSLVDGPV
jgi:PPM family protein phosphatase